MQITITATDIITDIDGVPVRLWEGVTEGGVKCQVFVHRVRARADRDCSEFERALKEMPQPRHKMHLSAIL